ncbi:Ff.00g130390.m01.CDS01 [Fusarium sp. VM40]|nr:Ff.00g130390.m01.CDS01 [Fusarium sp. VM40]
MDSALKYKEQLEEAGFVDINIAKRKWPTNHWPKDPKHKQIGRGGLGWSKEEVGGFLTDVREDMKNANIHSYWPM